MQNDNRIIGYELKVLVLHEIILHEITVKNVKSLRWNRLCCRACEQGCRIIHGRFLPTSCGAKRDQKFLDSTWEHYDIM